MRRKIEVDLDRVNAWNFIDLKDAVKYSVIVGYDQPDICRRAPLP